MSLEMDAICCSSKANLAKDKINLKDLQRVEKNLDKQEKISIIFLTSPTEILPNVYEIITTLLERNEEDMISRWITEFKIKNWEENFLESLLLIQNLETVMDLGFTESEINLFKTQFQTEEREVTPNLNRVLKTLYFLCEELDDKDRKLFVSYFEGIDIDREELELYLLFWIKTKLISISEASGNLKTLLVNLKKIEFDIDSPTYISLENWNDKEIKREISRNIPRNMHDAMQSLGNSLPTMEETFKEIGISNNSENNDTIYDFEKGLCFIINEEKFDSSIWKERFGSQKDIIKLKETFDNFGFEIRIKENLTFEEIKEELKILGNYTKEDYDCIIVCILSHGEKRKIVTKDGQKMLIGDIRDIICTPGLKNVVKIILVQACQGEYLGYNTTDGASFDEISDYDGPSKMNTQKLRDNIQLADSVMFVASIQLFKSIRNTVEGSWFIQTICKVLENEDRISWKKFALRVKNLVAKERGEVQDVNGHSYKNIVQIPEIVEDRLIKDFIFQRKKNFSARKKSEN